MPDAVLPPVRQTFRAVATTVVPEASSLDEEAWERAEALVEQALARRPADMRRQLRLFLRVVRWLPLVRYGRRFPGLSQARRKRVLNRMEKAPALLLRRGLWGVRTLAFMGFYGLPEVRSAMGYRAHPDGWSAWRGGAGGGPPEGRSSSGSLDSSSSSSSSGAP